LTVLEVKGLSIGFPKKPLFSNLSFRIQNPAFVAVVGHNGCGKSTFFRSLVKHHSFSGEIVLNGEQIETIRNLTAKGWITLLEQKNNIGFSILVRDLVLMGRFRFKTLFEDYSSTDLEIVNRALALLNISHLSEENFLNLSGGEQQLVWLAQVTVQDANIILLDEPTQQLDVYNRRKIFDLMQYWAYQNDKLIFCITHDLANLPALQGYVLNLSRDNPSLKPIDSLTIQDEIRFLENKEGC
jgi:iron complex transport system ATP-binding protein